MFVRKKKKPKVKKSINRRKNIFKEIFCVNGKFEFIGLLNISYNKGSLPINNIDSFMKTICIEIGMLVKRFRLSQRLSKELKERKELEEELELFLSTATDLLAIIDEKGNIKKVNSKWTETLGWSEEELYSINLGKIIHPDDLEKSKELLIEAKYISE